MFVSVSAKRSLNEAFGINEAATSTKLSPIISSARNSFAETFECNESQNFAGVESPTKKKLKTMASFNNSNSNKKKFYCL